MSWLLWVSCLLLLGSLVPFSVELWVRTAEGVGGAARIRWGGIALGRVPLRAPSARVAPAEHAKKLRREKAPPSWDKTRALVFSEDFAGSLVRWFRRLLRQLRPRDVRVSLRLGLGDPGDTGQLWGALAALFSVMRDETSAEINAVPDFLEAAFDLDLHATIRIVPLFFFATLCGYFFTRAPWRAVLSYARA